MPATHDVLPSPRISHEDLVAGIRSETDGAISVTLIEDRRLAGAAMRSRLRPPRAGPSSSRVDLERVVPADVREGQRPKMCSWAALPDTT